MASAATPTPVVSARERGIEMVSGVGPTRAKVFRNLGVTRVGDLLEYFPRDYQLETSELSIRQLTEGPVQTVRGTVCAVDYIPKRPRPRFEATLDDGTAKLSLTWFNGSYLRGRIHPGMTIRVQGKVGYFRQFPQMVNPHYEVVDDSVERITDSKFRAIYPASMKLPTEFIERVVAENLPSLLPDVHEWFDPALLARRGLPNRRGCV